MPRRDDIRIRNVYLQEMFGNSRRSGSRIFAAFDAGFRLKAADPLSEEESIWATMSQSPRDLAPLDECRVFVALNDRTAALYEEGQKEPTWKRPFSLAPESYLSAGPDVITAAEDDGTLHAIDPATGKTRWTRKVLTSPWTVQSSRHTTLLRQADGVVLVPDKRLKPTQLECIDAETGKNLWTVRGIDRLREVAVGQGLVVLGGPPGHVRALERGTGRPVFEVDLCPELKEKHDRVALALDSTGRHVYAAVRDRVWALDAATGHTLWQWTWQGRKATNPPRSNYSPRPRLYPVEDGLFALFNWSEPRRDFPPPEHVDVVRFTADGTVVLQETSPGLRGHLYAFVAGNRLALSTGGSLWEVWEFLPAP